jgi:sporulation protein YlmC with PRC-barrel domain
MANNDMDRVVPLGQLDDYRVAQDDPDVRGWEVLASDGRKIGEVDELLVDTNAMKVRYLDVDVDDGVIGDGMDRHVLIPIGYARLERDRDCVMVDGLASADLQGLPSYDQGPLTRDFESSVRESFSGRRTTPADTTTVGMSGAGAGTLDTAGLDNTPGTGTGLGMTGTSTGAGLYDAGTGMRAETAALGERLPDGEGMRAAGYDGGNTTPLPTGSTLRDTGSTTGLDSHFGTTGGMSAADSTGGALGSGGGRTDLGASTGGMSAGSTGTVGSGMSSGGISGGGMSAGSTGSEGGYLGGSGNRTELGGTARGDAMSADADDTLVGGMSAGAGAQGPVAGMGTDRGPQGDMSHRASSGMAGSDYLHNADEDFYASDAFDDSRFYGARRPGSSASPGGLGDSMGADRDETARLAREASERLREDERNRGVGGTGSL